MDQRVESIKTSHNLDGDTEALREYYAGWASDYDKDVATERYGGPGVIADVATTVARGYLKRPLKEIRVLDAGCGTGLAGIELKKRGFVDVDGFDLSAEMTEIADNTGAYDKLVADVDLNVDHENPLKQRYDLMVCCGVLTLGHVEPEALLRLADYLNEGGVMVVSTRNSYLKGCDYRGTADRFVKSGKLESLGCLPDADYIEEEGAHYWIYRKPASD
ncbi:class I SAM-dependent methyltransferase [Fulvimarina sp. MAC3]|uniref:class I SAM-dependent DNA methyltransferase n=1 Tax=Fulvimarina sp. MAC3 TaxID=3148887 RepID=UPI0031FBCE4C